MKRVLALHGHFQNASVLKRQLDAIESCCRDSVEFVVLDAPHVLYPADGHALSHVASAYTLNWEPSSESCRPRCWWRYLSDTGDSDAVIKSLETIRLFMEDNGPFHGVFGFSQGAAMAAMIAGWLEEPDMQPYFRHVNHPPFEFVVLISGFITPSPLFPIPDKIKASSLHVLGYTDTMVKPEWSKDLARRFDSSNVRIEMHQGGHFIPKSKPWRRFFVEYFTSLSAWQAFSSEPSTPTTPSTPDISFSISSASSASLPSEPASGVPSPISMSPAAKAIELSAVVHALSECAPSCDNTDSRGPRVTTIGPLAKSVDVTVSEFVRMASAALQPYAHIPNPYATIRSPTPMRFYDELVLYIQRVKEDGSAELVPSEPVSPRV